MLKFSKFTNKLQYENINYIIHKNEKVKKVTPHFSTQNDVSPKWSPAGSSLVQSFDSSLPGNLLGGLLQLLALGHLVLGAAPPRRYLQ